MPHAFMEYGEKNAEYDRTFWCKKLNPLRVVTILSDLPPPHKSNRYVIYCLLRNYFYNTKKTKGKYIWYNQRHIISVLALTAQIVNF